MTTLPISDLLAELEILGRRSPVGAQAIDQPGRPRPARGAVTPPSWRTNWRALGILASQALDFGAQSRPLPGSNSRLGQSTPGRNRSDNRPVPVGRS